MFSLALRTSGCLGYDDLVILSSFGKSCVYIWPWAALAILGWPWVTLGILGGIEHAWVSLDGMGKMVLDSNRYP